MNLISRYAVLTSAIAVLGGCAATSKTGDSPIPQDGRTMLDIYNRGPSEHIKAPPRTDDRVEKLCEEFPEGSQRQSCRTKAKAANLIVDTKQVAATSPVGEKQMAPRPTPLYDDYLRTAANEMTVLFPRLENPDIGIFIFPHLATANNVPIPGYATVMPLYDSVQYALPGEARSIK